MYLYTCIYICIYICMYIYRILGCRKTRWGLQSRTPWWAHPITWLLKSSSSKGIGRHVSSSSYDMHVSSSSSYDVHVSSSSYDMHVSSTSYGMYPPPRIMKTPPHIKSSSSKGTGRQWIGGHWGNLLYV